MHINQKRWIYLAGVWLIYFSFGVVAASMSPLIPMIAAELDIDNGRMGVILGAWPFVYLFAAIPCGVVLDRFSARITLAIAGIVIGLSGVMRALAFDEITMFAAVALFGVGGPLISVGAPKLIAQIFDDRHKGTALGINMTGPALGVSAALALTNGVMMPLFDNEWRLVLLVYGLFATATGVLWYFIASGGSLSAGVSKTQPSKPGGPLSLLKSVSLSVLLAVAVGIFFINHGMNNWLPEMLRANGLPGDIAGYLASLPTLVGIAGSLLVPQFATPDRRIPILAGLFLIGAVSTFLLHSHNLNVLLPALIAVGIVRGAMIPVATLALLETDGVDKARHGTAMGLFFAAGEFGGVTGPIVIGVLSAQSGHFNSAINALTTLCLILAALSVILARVGRRSGSG